MYPAKDDSNSDFVLDEGGIDRVYKRPQNRRENHPKPQNCKKNSFKTENRMQNRQNR